MSLTWFIPSLPRTGGVNVSSLTQSWRGVTWPRDSNLLLTGSRKMICKATGSGPPLDHWQEWFDGQV